MIDVLESCSTQLYNLDNIRVLSFKIVCMTLRIKGTYLLDIHDLNHRCDALGHDLSQLNWTHMLTKLHAVCHFVASHDVCVILYTKGFAGILLQYLYLAPFNAMSNMSRVNTWKLDSHVIAIEAVQTLRDAYV